MAKFKGKYRIETTRAQWWNYSNEGLYFITICTKNRKHLFGMVKNGEMILNENGKIVADCWKDLPNHYPNIIIDAFQIMPNHIHCIVGIDNTIFNKDSEKSIPSEYRISSKSESMFKIVKKIESPESIKSQSEIIIKSESPESKSEIQESKSEFQESKETGFKPVCADKNGNNGKNGNNANIENDANIENNANIENDADNKNDSNDNPNIAENKIKIHGVFEFIRALKSFSSRRINELNNVKGISNWQERFHDHIIRNEGEYDRIKFYIINNPKKWEEDCFNKKK
ncbi:MAG: hypothetical protein O9267_04015 [Flavobacterium sp.]|uniref:transposase n=1 Tax=Flavobacterium sp. TaxID=239 RepID=UPI0022C35E2A|nr:transposase [Flavobacterium sp.]MCZ8196750.1 hypothetical protein [Flavobacterium sp.]